MQWLKLDSSLVTDVIESQSPIHTLWTQQDRSRTPLTPIWWADPYWGVTMETKDTLPQDRQDSHCPVSRTWALVMRDLPGVGKTISSETQETRLQEVH